MKEFIIENLAIIVIIWTLLGVHSGWFLIKRYTLRYDFKLSDAWMLVMCFIFPIVTHIMTALVYTKLDKNGDEQVLFKKRR